MLKTGKAVGNDSISNDQIKRVHHWACIANSFQWSVGYISPVFKAGDIGDPNNYRGISVCSCLGKFFTLIIKDSLTKYWPEMTLSLI